MSPTPAELAKWRRTRLVAYVWCCDDELDGLCYEPRITRYTPNHKAGYPWLVLEGVWSGTFVNEPDDDERKRIVTELREAAERYGIPLEEKPMYWPHGVLDPEPQ